MPSPGAGSPSKSQRVIVSLPPELVADVERYAVLVREGDKSGFVADALRSYIEHLHKASHTAKLRQAYGAASAASLAITREWEPLDTEAWEQIDRAPSKRKDL